MYWVCMCTLCVPDTCEARRASLDQLNLELHMVLSSCHIIWMLETKLGFLGKYQMLLTTDLLLKTFIVLS